MSKIFRGIFGGSQAPIIMAPPPPPPPEKTVSLPKSVQEQLPDAKKAQSAVEEDRSAIEEAERRRKRSGRMDTVFASQRLGNTVRPDSVFIKTLLG
jgi:hypothetical protein